MLRTQDGASFAATSRQDSASTTCRHARAKPVGLAALTSVRLVGPLHCFLRSGARVGAEPDDCIQAIMQCQTMLRSSLVPHPRETGLSTPRIDGLR